MSNNLPEFVSNLQSCVKGLHWVLLIKEGPLAAPELIDAWTRRYKQKLELRMLGMKTVSEVCKLISQFPEAFESSEKGFTAKLITSSRAFKPKSDKVVEFLHRRYLEWYDEKHNNVEDTKDQNDGAAGVSEEKKDDISETPAKKQKTEDDQASRASAVEQLPVDNTDPEVKKQYLVTGALVIWGDGREGRISSAFPYLNQYWITDESGHEVKEHNDDDHDHSDMAQNKTFRMEDLRIPESVIEQESWECENLPDAELSVGSVCQVRTLLQNNQTPHWLDASILEMKETAAPGQHLFKVKIHATTLASKLNYANRIGNNVPADYVRWMPNRRKAALGIIEFIDLEKQAMDKDRTHIYDSAISFYEQAGAKLAESEQNLSRTDADFSHVKNHRLQIVTRVRYLRGVMKSGTGADLPLASHITTVQLSTQLHQLIRDMQRGQEADNNQHYC
eukprot:GEMP01024134.1.p1 GENE.GEMP01024134.1~~GEMP01024134.1.p1  ORF type:complete len:448 (+),score=81.23 GEMP01024134.1:101-1444(+)